MLTPKTITIGKTTYKVTSMETVEGLDGTVLYKLQYGKQVKSLFYSANLEMWTLYSQEGMCVGKVVPVVLNY